MTVTCQSFVDVCEAAPAWWWLSCSLRSCPAYLSVLSPERIPVAVTNLAFVVTACPAGANGLQMFTVCKCCTSRDSRNKIVLLQLPIMTRKMSWSFVCCVADT